ncbi:N-fatty-acyl-amino acid synthase/hydrolase PM20D1-like isoform X2 [Apostichopus japonicus]|uniref:N-fatty-acyl-amino acid synthase/hydrolase PM20D1-like isoform X2 n=1 Tax=Stichopus japonicus TaxID=307972 RepID=UPI003AB54587
MFLMCRMTGIFSYLSKVFFVGLIVLVTLMLIRTLTYPSQQPNVGQCSPSDADFIKLTDAMISNFQEILQIKTIAWSSSNIMLAEIKQVHHLLEKSYPHIHSSKFIKREVVNTYSLLYTVQGSDPSLKPYLLMGHMDVVPVDDQIWEVPPFEGRIKDGYLYGRGTIDNKNTIVGIMEALEFRLKSGNPPHRSFFIGLGHDEEVSGHQGAEAISKVLAARTEDLQFLLDEGMTVLKGVLDWVEPAVALIGVAEKGAVTLNVSVEDIPSGHSSMPGKESNIGVLAKALSRIEQNQHPVMFGRGPEKALLEALAPEAAFPLKFVLTNLWFFSPLVTWFLSQKPSTNAAIRTTSSVTMVGGGTKINVLPPAAWGVINHRIHPAQSIQTVIEYDRKLISDPRVKIQQREEWDIDPAPISPYGDEVFGYQVIARSLKQVFPTALIAPGMSIGNTDTKFYWNMTKQIYRVCPTFMLPSDLQRFHGINERISLINLQETINFYYHVMVNADAATTMPKHSHVEEL